MRLINAHKTIAKEGKWKIYHWYWAGVLRYGIGIFLVCLGSMIYLLTRTGKKKDE